MSKEQQISDIAYAIWESEGRPSGKADDHWAQAEAQASEVEKAGNDAPHKSATVTRIQRKTVRTVAN